MAKFWGKLLFLVLLLMPTTLMLVEQGYGSNVAFADDSMEGEDEEATVETEAAGDDDDVVEMGTQNSDVDYDWLPKETLQNLNKSPRRSPKQSPRQRRNLRSSGSKDD